MEINNPAPELSSYKDPDAQVFIKEGKVIRKIYPSYKPSYDKLMTSGLYDKLIKENLLIEHVELDNKEDGVYKTIEPCVCFISYPFEWPFSALKDAALATLKIQKTALEFDMSLKDANFYNIQFFKGKPVLIDTTSFELYEKDKPWQAYRQFCTNFLAPLYLMSRVDLRLSNLLLKYKDGIPLDLASKILPKSTFFDFGILSHIHIHARFEAKYGAVNKKINIPKMPKESQINFINYLIKTVKKIELKETKSEWKNYYTNTNYNEAGFEHKKQIIEKYKTMVNPKRVYDLGANTGVFSRIFSNGGIETFAFDIDENAVNQNYLEMKAKNEQNILPLILDLSNPTPSFGFMNSERKSFKERANGVNLTLALALVHHLRITYSLPFSKMAQFFSAISPYLAVEFPPKADSKVASMLLNRKGIFDDYTEEIFECEFLKYYKILSKDKIKNSERTLYLMERV